MNRAGNIAVWVVTVLLTALFVVMAAPHKLMAAEEAIENFRHFGYGPGFLRLIGTLELAGGLLLLWPRVAGYAAGVLGVVMIGALWSHLKMGETSQAITPVVVLLLLVAIGWARRPAILRGAGPEAAAPAAAQD